MRAQLVIMSFSKIFLYKFYRILLNQAVLPRNWLNPKFLHVIFNLKLLLPASTVNCHIYNLFQTFPWCIGRLLLHRAHIEPANRIQRCLITDWNVLILWRRKGQSKCFINNLQLKEIRTTTLWFCKMFLKLTIILEWFLFVKLFCHLMNQNECYYISSK